MRDIVKEIKKTEKNGDVREKRAYFRKETLISREYFNNEVTSRYSNLEFIRILMKKITHRLVYQESEETEIDYWYSVFIDKSILIYILSDNLINNFNGEKVIDLTRLSWKDQIELRNKILKVCPIIVAECNMGYNCEDMDNSEMDMKLGDNISVYPYNYKIENYELLNTTNFILISNSILISQKELDNLCLKMLKKLYQENQKVITSEKGIYMNIYQKLKLNEGLDQSELEVVCQFINSEITRIEKENTLLIRSRNRRK